MTEETYSTQGPECPYCGHVHDACDDASFFYNEQSTEMECSSCGRAFEMEVCISYAWTCSPRDEGGDEDD